MVWYRWYWYLYRAMCCCVVTFYLSLAMNSMHVDCRVETVECTDTAQQSVFGLVLRSVRNTPGHDRSRHVDTGAELDRGRRRRKGGLTPASPWSPAGDNLLALLSLILLRQNLLVMMMGRGLVDSNLQKAELADAILRKGNYYFIARLDV